MFGECRYGCLVSRVEGTRGDNRRCFREGRNKSPWQYLGGRRFDVQRRIRGSEHRASCKRVYLLICPCLHMYTIRLRSKFEEQENARYDPPMFLGIILKCLPCNISSFSSVQNTTAIPTTLIDNYNALDTLFLLVFSGLTCGCTTRQCQIRVPLTLTSSLSSGSHDGDR